MEIKIYELIKGARKATGLTVIIDVFRAFSTSCYIYNNGAERIIPVGDLKLAYKLKRENPHFLFFGERGGKKLKGFDFGNSPSQIEGLNFNGKTIIQTTSSGTKGLIGAKDADEIIAGSFINAGAIVKYIKSKNPELVSLVAMGLNGKVSADEDILCTKYIENALLDKPNNFEEIINHLRATPELQKFFDSRKDWFPEKDFKMCLTLNRFNFLLKVKPYDKNLVYLEKVNI
ncbi:2-phosphosulfolactate phosphatase [candidate division WOR-3 bacterium]|nr:2-phosphosulfolactate phosphatase [candidate division WOR-3 bacterium]